MSTSNQPETPTYIQKLSRWGTGVVGRSWKYEQLAAGRLKTIRVAGIIFVIEPFPAAMARLAAEDAERNAADAPENIANARRTAAQHDGSARSPSESEHVIIGR
jgi:hypothetical protein